MSKGYTSDGKRTSASTHARRSWTCSCGKVVAGNGGRSSHQRACLAYLGEMLAFHERMLTELIAGERRGSEAQIDRHRYEVGRLTELIAARAAREENASRTRGAGPAGLSPPPPSSTP